MYNTYVPNKTISVLDPVRAKMEGRWQPGESLPGLPAHLYNLFPDRLASSDLGEVPQGWSIGTLTDHFNLTMGQSPPGDTYNERRGWPAVLPGKHGLWIQIS